MNPPRILIVGEMQSATQAIGVICELLTECDIDPLFVRVNFPGGPMTAPYGYSVPDTVGPDRPGTILARFLLIPEDLVRLAALAETNDWASEPKPSMEFTSSARHGTTPRFHTIRHLEFDRLPFRKHRIEFRSIDETTFKDLAERNNNKGTT